MANKRKRKRRLNEAVIDNWADKWNKMSNMPPKEAAIIIMKKLAEVFLGRDNSSFPRGNGLTTPQLDSFIKSQGIGGINATTVKRILQRKGLVNYLENRDLWRLTDEGYRRMHLKMDAYDEEEEMVGTNIPSTQPPTQTPPVQQNTTQPNPQGAMLLPNESSQSLLSKGWKQVAPKIFSSPDGNIRYQVNESTLNKRDMKTSFERLVEAYEQDFLNSTDETDGLDEFSTDVEDDGSLEDEDFGAEDDLEDEGVTITIPSHLVDSLREILSLVDGDAGLEDDEFEDDEFADDDFGGEDDLEGDEFADDDFSDDDFSDDEFEEDEEEEEEEEEQKPFKKGFKKKFDEDEELFGAPSQKPHGKKLPPAKVKVVNTKIKASGGKSKPVTVTDGKPTMKEGKPKFDAKAKIVKSNIKGKGENLF